MKRLWMFAVLLASASAENRFTVSISGPEHRPATAQQITTLNQACPTVAITANIEAAEYFVVWDSKTWEQTSWGGHQQEFVVTNRAGDVVGSGKAHRISNAAKALCKVLLTLPTSERK